MEPKPFWAATVGAKPIEADGAVLVWGATTPAGCEAVRATYRFADVLSIEEMLDDLRRWQSELWMARVAQVGDWCHELTQFLGSDTREAP